MNSFQSIQDHNIYSDLIKIFINHGHKPYIVAPVERKKRQQTKLYDYGDHLILRVKIFNTSNVSFIMKGIAIILLNRSFISAINNKLKGIHFDLILYSTPPITIVSLIKKLKRQHKALTYLMLKDIFPQNAVDLDLFSKNSIIYLYFRTLEISLYKTSDYIGCMSPANLHYFLKNNTMINSDKVEILPNSIIPSPKVDKTFYKNYICNKYNIPKSSLILLYGGNLGKPQGLPFLIQCLKNNVNKSDRFFIICGTGSEFYLLKEFVVKINSNNILIINGLPKEEYDELANGCDIGLIFLDYRFTIPNFPSRILTYMEKEMPIIACTDSNTDLGEILKKNEIGLWCKSNNIKDFQNIIDNLGTKKIAQMGVNSRAFLEKEYHSEDCYNIIINKFKNN